MKCGGNEPKLCNFLDNLGVQSAKGLRSQFKFESLYHVNDFVLGSSINDVTIF